MFSALVTHMYGHPYSILGAKCTCSSLVSVSMKDQPLVTMVTDVHTVSELRKICQEYAKSGGEKPATGLPTLDDIYFGSSPSQVLYNLEVS